MSYITGITDVGFLEWIFPLRPSSRMPKHKAESKDTAGTQPSVCFLRPDNTANCITLVHMVRPTVDETL